MKKIFVSAILAGAVAFSASTASAQATIIDENFDSYANLAAVNAVWTQDFANYTLETDGGHSGSNYIRTPGAATGAPNPTGRFSRAINITPTDTVPLEVSFWCRVSSTSSGRSYLQLEAASTVLVNLGQYNNPGGGRWNYRTLGGGAPGTWKNTGAPLQVANTWTHLKVIVESRRVTYYADGVQFAQEARTSDWPALIAVRFGFGSGTSMVNTDFDDILVRTVSSVKDWTLY